MSFYIYIKDYAQLFPLLPCDFPSTASENERKRREASSGSMQAQFVSLGPLLMGENSTAPEENPCVERGIGRPYNLHHIILSLSWGKS